MEQWRLFLLECAVAVLYACKGFFFFFFPTFCRFILAPSLCVLQILRRLSGDNWGKWGKKSHNFSTVDTSQCCWLLGRQLMLVLMFSSQVSGT